jgi:hypothetical protein
MTNFEKSFKEYLLTHPAENNIITPEYIKKFFAEFSADNPLLKDDPTDDENN